MDLQLADSRSSQIPPVCMKCGVRGGGVCAALTAAQLQELNRQSARQRIEAGTEVVGQGEEIGTYANIMQGVVKLTKMMADGRQQIVGLQFAPDFIGRPFQRESTLSAEAATDTEICSFPRAVLERLTERTPELEHRLHCQSLKELDDARDWMLTLGRKTAHEKVASFLYLIASRTHCGDGVKSSFELPLSRADIADFLGLTIETVSRQMTKLRKDGTISIENSRHVTVPNMERLVRCAGNE
ncbi:Crp/Fnr family transcriptional regulator [Sinorhizobium sp. BG8]|uniref:Crp/Fnr family transcriptional regulator n=1 Tax=Sinorhizobium sp. BG8 TaxID=2613773 RepID=UPI00193CF847|nr:Crp/Fnr family transcriptional regulator [Sinorhizobium sp. BG8]QRM55781.1 Crp/Fnr family transcriptional regulator [Sinorhizobium sp. BG8]